MSAPTIQAQYDSLEEIAKRFDQQASDIEKMARHLIQMLEQLEGGGWEGDAAQAFFREMNDEVRPTINNLRDAFIESSITTQEIVRVMQAAEQEAANQFQINTASTTNGGNDTLTDDSTWDKIWGSMPGQAALGLMNGVWGFVAGSGNEFGKSYGPAAQAGSAVGDIGSSFLVYGDIRDLIIEGYKGIHPNMDANELNAILSGVGLVGDLGWLDGPIPDPVDGVNLGAASLKVVVKQLDNVPKPVRDSVGEFIKWGAKNPSQLKKVADLSQWMIRNHDTPIGRGVMEMMQEAAKNPSWYNKTADVSQWLKKEPDRFAELAQDAAHAGNVNYKSLHEAHVGLSLEQSKKLSPPITRSSDPKVDFVDNNNVNWDVKSFNSNYPNGYSTESARKQIEKEFGRNENVILDTTDMNSTDIADLRNLIERNSWQDRIIWHP